MKVLITNGSNPVTWYHDREGEVLEVTHIKDGHYFVPDQGPNGPYGVHFPDGELLYTEKEYNDLENHYMKLLDGIRNSRKVKLPCKVAEGLERALKWANGNHELVAWTIPSKGGSDDFWGVIFDYADEHGNFYKIIDALRNGYEIEDPHAEKKKQLLLNLSKIGYEGESARIIVNTIAPIIFEMENTRNG